MKQEINLYKVFDKTFLDSKIKERIKNTKFEIEKYLNNDINKGELNYGN